MPNQEFFTTDYLGEKFEEYRQNQCVQSGMVVHTFNARTWETEEEELCVPGQSGTLPQNNTTTNNNNNHKYQ